MSGIDLTIPWRGSQFLAGQLPLLQAQTRETEARVPLTEAQAQESQAHAQYYQPLTAKAQVEAEQARLMLDATKGMIQGIGYQGSNETLPPSTGSSYRAPAPALIPPRGGGGGGTPIGPGSVPPGKSTTDLTAGLTPQLGSTRLAMGYGPPAAQPSGYGSGALVGLGGTMTAGDLDSGGAFFGQAESVPLASPDAAAPGPTQPGPAPIAPVAPGNSITVTPQGPATQPFGRAAPGMTPGAMTPGAQQLQAQSPDYMQGSRQGVYIPDVGLVPRKLAQAYGMLLLQKGPVQAAADIKAARNNYLLQLAYNARTPEEWARNTEQAWREGFIPTHEYQQLHDHPEKQPSVIRGLQPPERTAQQDAEQRQAGNVWSYEHNAYVFDPKLASSTPAVEQGYRLNPDGKTYSKIYSTPAQRNAESGQPTGGTGAPTGGTPAPAGGASAAPAAAPGQRHPAAQEAIQAVEQVAPGPFSTYAANVNTHEGFKPTMGAFGWSPGTKAAQARKYAPEEVAGLTDAQITAKQLSPQAEARMMQGFTAENAETLTKNGVRPSAANLFMSHYIGPQGMLNLRKVSPDTTMAEMERRGLLDRGSVARNPELQGNTTAGGFIQWAQGRVGNETITAEHIAGRPGGGTTPPSAAPAVVPAPATPAVAPAPATPTTGPQTGPVGMPELGPGGQANLEQQQKAMDIDAKEQAAATTAGRAAGLTQTTVLEAKERLPNAKPGANFDVRKGWENFVSSWFPQKALDFAKWSTGKDFAGDPVAKAELAKYLLQLSLQQEAAMPGVRSGVGLSELMGNASPNPNMPEKAISDMLNAILIRNQAIRDYGEGFESRVRPRADAWRADNIRNPYAPVLPEWEGEWKSTGRHAPQVYKLALDMMNDVPREELIRRYGTLGREQKKEAALIINRIDPSWRPGETYKPKQPAMAQ